MEGRMTDWSAWTDEAERATYDPDDDKLRIYTDFVPRELYDAFRAAGFQRAPKQGCFYQVWNPAREDIALALCGEIEDEDTSLMDRAEDRHMRFVGYSANAGPSRDPSGRPAVLAKKWISATTGPGGPRASSAMPRGPLPLALSSAVSRSWNPRCARNAGS
jgi:hypothetical protein